MDADSTLEQGQHHRDLGKLLVLRRQRLNRILVDLLDRLTLILRIEVTILQRHRELLALALAEREDNAGVEPLRHDQSNELAHLLLRRLLLLLVLILLVFDLLADAHVVFYHLDRLAEIVLTEVTFLVYNQVDTLCASREQVVLEWSRSEVSIDDRARLILDLDDPFTELSGIGNSS